MYFETTSIYAVNPKEHSLEERLGKVRLKSPTMEHENIKSFFPIGGTDPHDLAIFGYAIDKLGVTACQGLLVFTSDRENSLVALDTVIEENPVLQTPTLAKKFSMLRDEELAQLNIDSLVAAVRKRHPSYFQHDA